MFKLLSTFEEKLKDLRCQMSINSSQIKILGKCQESTVKLFLS